MARVGNTYRAQFEYTDETTNRLVKFTALVAGDSIDDVATQFSDAASLTVILSTVPTASQSVTPADVNVFSIQRVEAAEDGVAITDPPAAP